MGLLFFDNTGDQVKELGSQLSDKDIKESMKLEDHAHVLDRYMSEIDGKYGWQGAYRGNGGQITLPSEAMTKGAKHSKDRHAAVMARMSSGHPPQLLSYDLDTDTPILAVEDMECYEAGYICPNCIQYQSVPNTECNWRHVPSDAQIKGCGYNPITAGLMAK